MSSKMYALFIWYNDVPITGSIINLSSVIEPRKDFKDYRIGDVKAKCGSFGVFQAVIGMIADENGKKDMDRVLKGPVSFKDLVDSRPEVLEMIKKHEEQEDMSANKSVENKNDKNCGLVKPKAVKRKLSVVSDVKQSEKLQSAAEDVALADLKFVEDELQRTDVEDERMDSSHILGESLAIIATTGLTPQKSPRRLPPTKQNLPEVEQLRTENAELFNRVGHLEYTVGSMWHEMEKLKSQLMEFKRPQTQQFTPLTPSFHSQLQTHPQSAFTSPEQHTSTFMSSRHQTPTATTTSPAELDEIESLVSPQSSHHQMTESEKTYNGYVKSQVKSELNMHPNFKKATAKLFRMLFNEDETRGRSLYGKSSNSGNKRPALDDKDKLKFLEDVIIEKWQHTPVESIRMVMRDMLKPSRVQSAKKK